MGLLENMQNEPVNRLALREPVTASPRATLRDVVGQMRDRQLGCAIAVDEARRPLGIFTESMLTQLLAQNPEALDDPLDQHLSRRFHPLKATNRIVDVLEAMQLHDVRFVAVVDEHGLLIGLTGQKGLMEYVAEHFPGQVMVQRIGSTPYLRQREGA